jgi:hypothetical protein
VRKEKMKFDVDNITSEAKTLAYEAAAEILLDDQLWHDAKMFANAIWDSGLTKEEKHAEVKSKLEYLFNEIATSLIDIAIKLAYLYIKNVVKN